MKGALCHVCAVITHSVTSENLISHEWINVIKVGNVQYSVVSSVLHLVNGMKCVGHKILWLLTGSYGTVLTWGKGTFQPSRSHLKRDGTRAETMLFFAAKRRSPFNL